MSDYILSIASQDKRHEGEEFRVFHVDGEDVIGVEEREPFELRFRNNTNQPVQIRLSVDGTDVLSGKPASTKPTGEMFLVSPHDSMSLKAWPESMDGGARFVFTTSEKSVAVNTHGNTAGIGLIAAAIYTDYDYYGGHLAYFQGGGQVHNSSRFTRNRRVGADLRGMPMGSKSLLFDATKGAATKGLRGRSEESYGATLDFCAAAASIDEDSNIAVGAGEYTNQTLVKAAGLRRPVLDDIIQVRYLPWEKLRKLVAREIVSEATAFPGDHNQKVDLSNVPRTKSTARRSPEVHRFL